MDNMYELYNGFKEDAPFIFKELIDNFNFRIKDVSNYGISLLNDNCKFKIFREGTLIVWYFDKYKYNEGILLTEYFYSIDKKKYNELNKIYFQKIDKQYFFELSKFLIDNSNIFQSPSLAEE